jgi:hypothetical protein
VVAVRTEREPNRYEPLNETHRRVGEEEEKRRLAEADQARSASARPEPEQSRLQPEAEQDENSPEARLAARKAELEELVKRGRINQSEMTYRLAQFDNELAVEIEHGTPTRPPTGRGSSGNSPPELSAENEHKLAEPQQQTENATDRTDDRARDEPSRPRSEKQIEHEAEAAAYEITGRGEMTDARAARLARLRGFEQDIERETREGEGKGADRSNDPGDRSR